MALITYLTHIEFEAGAIRLVPQAMEDLGVRCPLVITDAGVLAAGLLDRLLQFVPRSAHAAVFHSTPQNPTEDAVEEALLLFRERACDGLIALGGGSPIDLAKGVGLLASHSGPLETYAAIAGGAGRITSAVLPVIAVPTTAGTGSEVGRAALITLRDGRKLAFISPFLIPKRAICDAELTMGLPPGLTAATGMDALTHCIETFLSPRLNPPADAIALDGAARAWTWIERAVRNGGDAEARQQMMMAALEGGLTFQKGLGAVHGMSHALGGSREPLLHHGTLNAVLLPTVLRYNESHAGERYGRLRQAIGLPANADLAAAIEALNERIGMPRTLAALGVPSAALPAAAERAFQDHSTATNPRPLSVGDYAALLEQAMG